MYGLTCISIIGSILVFQWWGVLFHERFKLVRQVSGILCFKSSEIPMLTNLTCVLKKLVFYKSLLIKEFLRCFLVVC